MQRRKYAVRLFYFFFTVMIILTLCSRSIYRSMLPKVSVKRPSGGMLKIVSESNEYSILATTPIYQFVPYRLAQPLRITEVHVRVTEEVRVGDPLVTIYAPEGELLLKDSLMELEKVKAERKIWQNDLLEEKGAIVEILESSSLGSDRKRLVDRLEILQRGYYEGRYADSWQEEIEQLSGIVDFLLELRENQWVLTSAYNGTICEVYISKNSNYSGIDPLVCVAPDNDLICMELVVEDDLGIESATWSTKVSIDMPDGTLSIDGKFVDDKTIQINLPQEIDVGSILSVDITFESPYQQLLVPNEAMHGQYVYILENDIGDWGETVYIVHKVFVEIGGSDSQKTAIISGLRKNDQVIVMSTKVINDDQVVLLEGYE